MDEKKKRICEFSLDEIRFVRESLLKELEFRREKQWRIFSWVSSILVGVTAGIIALNGKDDGFEIRPYHKGLLIFAIAVLTAYACVWIRENRIKEKSILNNIQECDARFEIQVVKHTKAPNYVGYVGTTALLAVAAILVTLLVGGLKKAQHTVAPQATPPPNNSLQRTRVTPLLNAQSFRRSPLIRVLDSIACSFRLDISHEYRSKDRQVGILFNWATAKGNECSSH